MLKATIAIVSLLFVACVCVLFHLASAPAAAGMVSAVFLILLLVSTKAGAGSRSGGPRRSRSLRYAAPGLVVLLAYGLVWATPITPTLFNGVVTTLPLGTLTLADPTSVALDGQGDVYIADAGHHQIVEVSAAGVASVVAFPGLSPALFNPSAVALDGSGNLYVVDPHNVRVVELSAAGVASVVPTGGLLSLPSGLAIDAAGDLYIADQANNDIVEVADGTAAVLAITGLVTPLHEPAGLAVDASGNLYIADLLHGRIVVVAPGGAGSVLAITGLGTTNLYRPAGVAVDGLGNVYIADTGNSRVVTVTPQGVSAILGTGTVTLDYPGDVAVSAMGAVYIVDSGNNQVVEVMDSAVGFGHLFVPFATIFPTTLTLPFTIGSATYGSVQTFTQGTPGIDFSVASTTCVSGTTTGAACTVNVSFEPAAPGLRRGALVLFNNAVPPLPILTVLLYGIGDAPLAALSPGTASIISSGMVNALSSPQQVALDGAGNLYVANSVAENVLKIPPGGGSSSIVDTGSVNLETPVGVAVDGAGNLYIGDVGAYTHRIVEVTSAGVASVLTITGLVPPLAEPGALTVDAAGNLYIADFNRYVKVTPAGVGSVVATPGFTLGSLGTAKSIAVDAAGTVYLSDSVNNRVLKVTADGAASVVVPADIVPVLNDPAGVSVDGMGNLYIADSGNNRIVEVTTAGIASVVQTPALTSPATLAAPFATAVDNSGNVFVSDSGNNRVVEVSVAGASLAFPNTNVDSSSTAQTATVTNLGDLPLVFSANPSYTLNFSENTGDENLCAASSSLAPGTVCDVSVDFTPQSAGILSASIVATNNNLNNYFDATETVAVSGTGVSTGDMTAVTVSTNPATVILGQAITITATVTDATAGETGMIPTGGVTFTDQVGSTVIELNSGNPVTLNGSGQAILTGITLAGTGLHTITANYAGVSGTFSASTNFTTIQVAPLTTAFQVLTTTLATGGLTLAPYNVAVDGPGNVYIADYSNNQIVVVTPAGVVSALTFASLSGLAFPEAVAVDGSGNIYVADTGNDRVVELSAGGVESVVSTASLLSSPDGLTVDASGNLYIADNTKNYIVEVPAGGTAAQFMITGLDTALSGPASLALDALGNLYIADVINNRIVEVAPGGAGTALSITGLSATLSRPQGVAVDGLGNVYIADRNNNRIVTVTSAGVGAVLNTGADTLSFPQGVAVGVFGTVYVADSGNARIVEVQPSAVGYGHLPLGTTAGTTLTLPFSVAASSTLGSVQAFALGAPSLDFTVISAGTTCVAGTTDVLSCSVNIQFLPTAAGLRRGEVVLFDQSVPPIPLLSVSLYGTGDAPLATLSPGTASVLNTGGVATSDPYQVALDGAGNVYAANEGSNNVVKIAAGGGASVVSTGILTLTAPAGVALDGAGDLYIADQYGNRIVQVTPAGVASVLSIAGLTNPLIAPTALALDAAGNLYMCDGSGRRIVKVTPAGAASVVGTGSYTLTDPTGLAVDGAGTIYIADQSNSQVVKVTADGAATLLVPAGITPALSHPDGVSVDGMGNLYISDTGNARVVEVTTAGVASVVQIPGLTTPVTYPTGTAVDTFGNVFIPDLLHGQIVEVNVSGASLAFPNTDVGANSVPQTATVTNIGDLPLVFSAAPTYTANFTENLDDPNLCAANTSLAAGTVCDVSVFFDPQSAGLLNASIGLTNNSLNGTGAPESVAVSGTGVSASGDSTQIALFTTPTSVNLGQSLTVTATVTDSATGHATTVPTGGVTFTDTLGSTTIPLNGGAAVTLNGAGQAILTGVTLAGAGLHTITTVYPGVNNAFLPSAALIYTLVTASALPVPTINWTSPAGGITYGTTLTGILNATAVSGSTPVAGTFSYMAMLAGGSAVTVTGSTVLGAGSYTLTVTFTPTDSSAYASASANVSLTVAKATPAVALTSSAAAVGVGSAVTFTATVSSAAGTPSGSVSFYDGATLLGSGTLALGVATYTSTSLPVGALSITAVYSGDSNFSTLTSSALTESVMTTFTVTAPTAPVTVVPGGSVTVDLTVPALGGAFNGVVTLSASGLPPGATATFNPATVTPGAAGATAVMTIQLAAATASVPASHSPSNHGGVPVVPFSLGFIVFGAVLGRKRIPRGLVLVLALVAAGITTSLFTACGGGFANNPPTQAGNYTVTVTGTSGALQASTTITLAVE